jgi:hypothetical protein
VLKSVLAFARNFCHVQVKPKFVAKELTIRPPVKSRDPDRIIPRVIHQTWFEELTPDKYEYLSNYTESFRSSGWDYKFYTDKDAANFLSTHFPPEFREVFDTLNAGAFKADFFRYCVLFIHGGVYSDVDIRLDSDLDISVPEDVGFMVAFDRVSSTVQQECGMRSLTAYVHGFKLEMVTGHHLILFISFHVSNFVLLKLFIISCSLAETPV